MWCVLTAGRANRYHYHPHSLSPARNLIITTQPLTLSIPPSESKEVMGNMNQHAGAERVILVLADDPTPQLFNNATRLIH